MKVKQFVSFREAGKYLNMSHSNVSRYLKSGNLISRRDGKYPRQQPQRLVGASFYLSLEFKASPNV